MKLISTGGKRILSLRAKAKLRRRLRYWIPATVVALGIGLLALTGPGQSLLASANAKPLPIYCVDTGGEKKESMILRKKFMARPINVPEFDPVEKRYHPKHSPNNSERRRGIDYGAAKTRQFYLHPGVSEQ